LPEKEREELIKSDKLATILEGGDPQSTSSSSSSGLQAIAQHPMTQSIMSGIEAMGSQAHPMLQAVQGVHSFMSTGNPIPLANVAIQYATKPQAATTDTGLAPAIHAALAKLPVRARAAALRKGYFINPKTRKLEKIPPAPPLNPPPPPPPALPKANTSQAAPGDHRLAVDYTVPWPPPDNPPPPPVALPKAWSAQAAAGDPRLRSSGTPYLIPTVTPAGEGIKWVRGSNGQYIKIVPGTRQTGTGEPKKKAYIKTSKPLLPYFDINRPILYKKT